MTTEQQIQDFVDTPGVQARAAGRTRAQLVWAARHWFRAWDLHVSAPL